MRIVQSVPKAAARATSPRPGQSLRRQTVRVPFQIDSESLRHHWPSQGKLLHWSGVDAGAMRLARRATTWNGVSAKGAPGEVVCGQVKAGCACLGTPHTGNLVWSLLARWRGKNASWRM